MTSSPTLITFVVIDVLVIIFVWDKIIFKPTLNDSTFNWLIYDLELVEIRCYQYDVVCETKMVDEILIYVFILIPLQSAQLKQGYRFDISKIEYQNLIVYQ